jgi:transketolase
MTSNLFLAPHLYDEALIKQLPTRDGYGDALVELGKSNPKVVVLTADLAESTRVLKFQQQFPERFVEVGVAEQNMMGIAAGLALSGKIPFVSSYGVFSPGRNWDQLRVSVCYSQTNVKIMGSHTGISVGPDGATHQAMEDIAITRVLPNIIVIAPCDYLETKKATKALAQYVGPAYMRFGRNSTPVMTTEETPFEIGKAYVMREGHDVSLIACGPLLYEALQAAEVLAKEDISAEVINNPSIKPLDKETLLHSVRKTKAVVTVEEHQIMGGMGSAVGELVLEHEPVPLIRVGMQDQFGQSGKPAELLAHYHMTRKDIVKAVHSALKIKNGME